MARAHKSSPTAMLASTQRPPKKWLAFKMRMAPSRAILLVEECKDYMENHLELQELPRGKEAIWASSDSAILALPNSIYQWQIPIQSCLYIETVNTGLKGVIQKLMKQPKMLKLSKPRAS